MIFPLVQDFADALAALPAGHPRGRLLRLLDEAVRRDAPFVARHPTSLFQCLWNSGWWYDCPRASEHYPPGGAADPPRQNEFAWLEDHEQPRRHHGPLAPAVNPWDRPGLRLSDLLAAWRGQKERGPGVTWLRSGRPPADHLGTSLLAAYPCSGDLAFSPDGRRVATTDRAGARVWDVGTGAPVCEFGGPRWVYPLAWAPGGLAVAGVDVRGTVRRWDPATGVELGRLPGDGGRVTCLAFARDGRLAAASTDGTIRVWDAAGAELLRLAGPGGRAGTVAWRPDGGALAGEAADGTVYLWDAQTGAELGPLPGSRRDDHVGSDLARFRESWGRWGALAWSPDGRQVAGGVGNQVLLWDAADRRELARLDGHAWDVVTVAFSPDGRRLASGSADSTVRVWDVAARAEVRRLQGHAGAVGRVAFSPDGRLLASAGGGTARVWDVDREGDLRRLQGHTDHITHLAGGPDGGWLITLGADRAIRVWDAVRGTERRHLPVGRGAGPCAAVSPGGVTAVAAGSDVRVWDALDGGERRPLTGHKEVVSSLAFSPDGHSLASGAGDGTVRVWDVAAGAEVLCLRVHPHRVYNPEQYDGSLHMVDGGYLVRLVRAAAFSPDGRFLATGSDPVVRLWDLADGRLVREFEGHTGDVRRVAFGPQGRTLVSGSDDTVRRWDVAGGACLEVLDRTADVGAVAAGPDPRPWRALAGDGETRVEAGPGGPVAAWFPTALGHLVCLPSGRTWAGAVGHHLVLFTLECGTPHGTGEHP